MDGSNLKMIEALLATYIEKDEHQVRHVAVQYAGEVFPPSHTPSKFVLLLGAGDSKDEVKIQFSRLIKSQRPIKRELKRNEDLDKRSKMNLEFI